MGLYDARLAELSEHRQPRRVAQRSPYARRPSPVRRPSVSAREPAVSEAHRKSMRVQSLLFDRKIWTPSKAKAWAKSNGYRYGKVDITDQYIRIRQFDPKGSKVKRTIPFGRGIRAVVAREETQEAMRTAKEAPRRRRRRHAAKKKAPTKRRSHRRRKVMATEARRTHRRRRKTKVEAKRRKTHRRRRHTAAAGYVMARRRRHRTSEAWRGHREEHAKAARKGWRRKKRKSSAPKRRRRRRHASEATVQAPRRRRRRSHEAGYVMQAPRRRRRRHHARSNSMFEAKRGGGMSGLHFGLAVISGGVGFVAADALDRLLATYNPSSTDPKPTDRFTSDGAGTIANTLNVAAMPNWKRLAAGAGVVLVPALGSMAVDHPAVKSSLEGMAFGAGIKLISTLWNNVLMPMLVGKDTSVPTLQKSYIARLYPAEVAARINQQAQQQAVSSAGSGALSGHETGVAGDVGPFALAAESPYPSAVEALRAGVSDFPTVQNTMGTGAGNLPTVAQVMGTGGPGGNFPTVAQVMGTGAPAASGNPGQPGLSEDQWQPGPPPGPGPGPQARPHTPGGCGCMADGDQFLGFIGDQPKDDSPFLTMN